MRDDDLGLAMIRDGNSSRSFETLQRYRGGALAELFRALRELKALQAARASEVEASERAVAQHRNEPETRVTAGPLPPPPFAGAVAAAGGPGALPGLRDGMAAACGTNPKPAPALVKAGIAASPSDAVPGAVVAVSEAARRTLLRTVQARSRDMLARCMLL
jgi:hypothetical protein